MSKIGLENYRDFRYILLPNASCPEIPVGEDHVTPQPNQGRARFNQGVHGARGLFAFLVFVFHVVNSGLQTIPILRTAPAQFILRTPEYGVELFFCISGFVIAGTLSRARSPQAFLEDRAIRIYPVLSASVLAIVGLGFLTHVHAYPGSVQSLGWIVPLNMLALPGALPLPIIHPAAWSLSYEIFFYLFCAACWVLRSRLGRALPWVAGPVGIVMIVFYPRAIFFAAGVLVARGWLRHPFLRRATDYPLLFILLFLGTWRFIQQLTLPQHITTTTLLDWATDARLPLAVLAFLFATLGFAGIVEGHGSFVAFLRTRPLQYLGTISYSFYIWHPIVMSGAKTALLRFGAVATAGEGAQLLFFIVALPPSLLLAHVSERLLERRLAVALRQRLYHSPPRQPPPTTPEKSVLPALEKT